MKLEWTEQALEAFRNLRSQHYTQFETAEYKKRLLDNIQEKVILLGTSIPVKKRNGKAAIKSLLINLLFITRSRKSETSIIKNISGIQVSTNIIYHYQTQLKMRHF